MIELKSCPFCGGNAGVEKRHNNFGVWYECFCSACHVTQYSNDHRSESAAIEAWNRRANDEV